MNAKQSWAGFLFRDFIHDQRGQGGTIKGREGKVHCFHYTEPCVFAEWLVRCCHILGY